MVLSLVLILGFQLAGEGFSRWFGVPVPGPVIGLALLLAALILVPPLGARVKAAADGLLAHLALLFVPAGVGIVGHLDRFSAFGAEIAVILIASTLGAIVIGAAVFVALSRDRE